MVQMKWKDVCSVLSSARNAREGGGREREDTQELFLKGTTYHVIFPGQIQ